MIERLPVLDEVELMAPGPQLAAVLAALDTADLPPRDLLAVARARLRQVNHEHAGLLGDLVEIERRVVETAPPDTNFAADEIAAGLTWTSSQAAAQLRLAQDVVVRWPVLAAAMRDGLLDLARAKVITEGLVGVTDAVARHVIDEILPEAPRLTTSRLRARLARLVMAVDPAAAQRRYEQGITERRVTHGLLPDNTAMLAAWQLPADKAAAAAEKITDLARARKRDGDSRTMDQLRADVYLDLLLGNETGPAPRRGGVELVVPLTTLLALSDAPGELAGWGPVVADIARQVAEDQADGAWRYTVTNRLGEAVHHGPVRRRPTARDAAFVRARDRTCRFPGCRAPGVRTEIDHTVAYAEGGPTARENLGLLCKRHHLLKHRAGWDVYQSDGTFLWRSPLGACYAVGPDRLTGGP